MTGSDPGPEPGKSGGFPNGTWALGLLALAVLVGTWLRIKGAQVPVWGDEMSTLWITTNHRLVDVWELVHSDAEITPPLYFLLSWAVGKVISDPEMIRLPAMISGIFAIPATYLIGLRAIGRRAATIGALIAATAPFLVYYSANARGYTLGMLMVLISTLAMLLAIEKGQRRWWVVYALGTCLAMYSHYTMATVLIGQLVWLLWRHPSARVPALVANVGAAILFLPWFTGFMADTNSVTIPILELLQGDGFTAKRQAVEGAFFLRIDAGATSIYSTVEFWLVAAGLVGAGAVGAWRRFRTTGEPPQPKEGRPGDFWLILIMSFSTLFFEILLLAFGTDILGTRNLAAMWIALPLLMGAILASAGPRWAVPMTVLVLAGMLVGSFRINDQEISSVAYTRAADEINANPDAAVVTLDYSHVTPSPLAPIKPYLDDPDSVETVGTPPDYDGFIDHLGEPVDLIGPPTEAFTGPGPVRILSLDAGVPPTDESFLLPGGLPFEVPPGWRIVQDTRFPGLFGLYDTIYARDQEKKQPEG